MKALNKALLGLGGTGVVASMPEEAGAELKIFKLIDPKGIVRTRSAQWNPTWGELKTQFEESAYQALRALLWTDDAGKTHLVTFDAQNLHNAVKRALKIPDEADHLWVGGDMDRSFNFASLKHFAKRFGVPGTPAAAAGAGVLSATETEAKDYRSRYSPEAAKEVERKRMVDELEGGGLKEAPNPVEWLSPAKLGGGAVSAALDVGSSLLSKD